MNNFDKVNYIFLYKNSLDQSLDIVSQRILYLSPSDSIPRASKSGPLFLERIRPISIVPERLFLNFLLRVFPLCENKELCLAHSKYTLSDSSISLVDHVL